MRLSLPAALAQGCPLSDNVMLCLQQHSSGGASLQHTSRPAERKTRVAWHHLESASFDALARRTVHSSSPGGDSIHESLHLEAPQIEGLHASAHGLTHPAGDLLHHLCRSARIRGAGHHCVALQVLLQVLHLR